MIGNCFLKKRKGAIIGNCPSSIESVGSIIGAVVRSTGFDIDLKIKDVSWLGLYDFSLGLTNDPATAKIRIRATSSGYDPGNVGIIGTNERFAYGMPCMRPLETGAMRKAYPNQAIADETISGSDVIIRIAISEYIYSGDTNILLTIGTGFYTQNKHASLSANNYPVINNSAIAYSTIPVIGHWAEPQFKTITESTVSGEIFAHHRFAKNGKPVAYIVVTATDGVNSVSTTVIAPTVSAESPINAIITYPYSFDLSAFTDLSIITRNFVAYPWVGDATSVLDTNDGAHTGVTPEYAPLKARLDKNDIHGKTVIDPAGNDGTGLVYATRELAEAGNAFLTPSAALTALAAYNNTHAGHNDAGGSTIYARNNTWAWNTNNGGTGMTEWVTITPATGATKAGVIIQAGAAGATHPYRFRMRGLTWSGSNGFLPNIRCIGIEDCVIATTGSYSVVNFPYGYIKNCISIGATSNRFNAYSTYMINWHLIRGTEMNVEHKTHGFCILGNRGIGFAGRSSPTSNTPLNDNGIYAFNEVGNTNVNPGYWITNANENYVHGLAIIQNLVKQYGDEIQPAVGICADGSTASANNILIHNNTFPPRANLGYNDTATGGPYARTNWSIKNNIFANYNNKADIFGSNPLATGGWSINYGVGSSGNLYCNAKNNDWFGANTGLYMRKGTIGEPLVPLYILNNMVDGNNTSGGDYHLQAESPAIGITHDLVMPFDFEGNARLAVDAAGIYVYR